MGKRTSYSPGTFSWVDLATTDAAAAKAFAHTSPWSRPRRPGSERASSAEKSSSASASSSARRSRPSLQQVRWLGFALVEAVAFYTFIFGLIAFFISG
jgi:hypothetical protein